MYIQTLLDSLNSNLSLLILAGRHLELLQMQEIQSFSPIEVITNPYKYCTISLAKTFVSCVYIWKIYVVKE